MKAVKVTYTVRPEFAAKNKENIKAFLDEVKQIGDPEMRYNVFVAEDGKTFSHLSMYTHDDSQARFLNLESFKSFQKQRDESRLEAEPKIEAFTLFQSSHDVFN